MELIELKETWKKEQKEFMARIELSEKKLNEITFNNSKSKFDQKLMISILGRNMALVYCCISIWFAYRYFEDYVYTIPVILGGIAMLFSFFQHRSLKKPNYSSMSIVELQKTVHKFRIHTKKIAKFDKGIVLLWFLTISPLILSSRFNFHIFSNFRHIIIFSMIAVGIIILLLFNPFGDIYKRWDSELKATENELAQILEFESE